MILHSRGSGRGEQVARDGGINADVGGFALHALGESLPPSCKAQGGPGMDESEEGDRSQDFLIFQERLVLERRAGDRSQYINRYGRDGLSFLLRTVGLYAARKRGIRNPYDYYQLGRFRTLGVEGRRIG